ncbi:hypothetical protein [Cerasicoccus arenae]|uniref:PEP-CTERM protein-sorting domain-containing protein n=1 Tax=Cerasicoccus arenae TaxID=424488 RepID=A0A8J3DEJ6_9BACT|nr:hypothetical protein [Cerasicoccus arenae]MBK1857686.1 hypothetical protein [Cerasicoccus arenae]GHB91373.1 hypothetical protein GCM10007047_03060 [Cerasicoccus arenae]
MKSHLSSSLLCALAILPLSAPVLNAASLVPSAGYSVGEVLSTTTLGAFDIYDAGGAKAYGWDSGSSTLRNYSVSNGGVLGDFGAPPGGYADSGNAFVSFVRRSSDGNSVWVGFTVGGNSDDRIYEVTDLGGTPTWNLRTTLAGNYDLEFSSSGAAFASANLGGFSNPNKLFYLDAGDGFSAIEFAETGGYSADLAFDVTGALIYATSGLGAEQLVSFSNGNITAFLSDTGSWSPLGLGDASLLSDLPAGGSGLYADAFGGVFVSMSDFSGFPFAGTVAQWNGNAGSGENLDILATVGDSLGELDGLGELANGGELFQSVGYGGSGLDTISVPEPADFGLAAGLLSLALIAVRRRRA